MGTVIGFLNEKKQDLVVQFITRLVKRRVDKTLHKKAAEIVQELMFVELNLGDSIHINYKINISWDIISLLLDENE